MGGRRDTPENPPGEAPPSLTGGRGLEEDKEGEPRLEGIGEVCSLQFLLGKSSSLIDTSPLPPWSGVDTRYSESWILDGLVAALAGLERVKEFEANMKSTNKN